MDVIVVTRVCPRLREVLLNLTELEAGKFKGEIELVEAYFRGRLKGKCGRAAAGKRIVRSIFERNNCVWPKVVEWGNAEDRMKFFQAKTQ